MTNLKKTVNVYKIVEIILKKKKKKNWENWKKKEKIIKEWILYRQDNQHI